MGYIVESRNGGSKKKYFESYETAYQRYLDLKSENAIITEAIKINNLVYSRPLPENTGKYSCMAIMTPSFSLIEKLDLSHWDKYVTKNEEYNLTEFETVF